MSTTAGSAGPQFIRWMCYIWRGKCFLKMSSTENFLREAHKEMRLRITKMEEAVDRKVIQCVPNPYDTYQELDERCSHCQLLRRIICIACSPEKEEE